MLKDLLKDRASMMSSARSFFFSRKVTETDVPILSKGASVDAHIDLIPSKISRAHTYYLHSSPEYGMKRLLSEGSGDIYQLSHVFRDGEISPKHRPEFMMCEWYRLNFSFQQIIDETLDFIRLFLGPLPAEQKTYRKTLLDFGIDPFSDYKTLEQELIKRGVEPYPGLEDEGTDGCLNLILSHFIEPTLGQDKLFVLSHYPASQAALAKTTQEEGHLVAERFEVYYKGYELANGYHELADPIEQEKRLIEANEQRIKYGKEALPIDYKFLDALKKGMPPCCGVAVGFDRLMMLRHNRTSIRDILPLDDY